MAAFLAARELGADGVELDVHLTADGAVVVHHDADLAWSGADRAAHLGAAARVASRNSKRRLGLRPLRVNVEIKHDPERDTAPDALAGEVAALLTAREETSRVVVSSFSLAAIDAVRARAPQLATALLLEPVSDPMEGLETARGHGHGGLHPFFLAVDTALMKAAARAGVAVRVWTVNEPDAVRALAGLGVDAVITDDVPAALGALGRAH